MSTCNIHSIESLAARDGDGVRCAVFFCGCPLRCVYCHNPDTWHQSGNEMSAEKLANKLVRYKPYFKTDGGVTFSGGEPLLHASYINEVASILKEKDVNYMLDTSGCVDLTDDVKTALTNAQGILLDLKFYNAEKFEKYCKGDFDKLLTFIGYCKEINVRITLRTVIVPGINDSEEEIEKYAEFAKRIAPEKYELLPFHTMGFFKYKELGIENPLEHLKALSPERKDELQKYLDELMAESGEK